MLNLVGSTQRVVDTPDHCRHRVRRIQRLVGIHLTGEVCIARHLPARQVDRIQSRPHLLHGLVAGHRTECIDERFLVEVAPELFSCQSRDGMLHGNGAAKSDDIFGFVAARHAPPTGTIAPGAL